MDLQAAEKTAIVVKTLNQIAEEKRKQFEQARSALTEELTPSAANAERRLLQQRQLRFRERHQDLWQRWQAARLTPRQLRIELLEYYVERGQQGVTKRFFPRSAEGL